MPRCVSGAAAAVCLAACLAGCSSMSEQTAASAFISPGAYDVYTCQDVEKLSASMRARQVELEQLMARASQGAGGELVSSIAYRSEYAQARGMVAELAKAKADKRCASESEFSSKRAVF
jgi:hypothetical protein